MSVSPATSVAVHSFIWVDLVTPNPEASQKFYAKLFGWEQVGFDNYTMFTKDSAKTAGMMVDKNSAVPEWVSYVYVQDADQAARDVVAQGGTILAEPTELMGQGRMAIVQDPTGVTFRLWQPLQEPGGVRYNDPGSLCWNELMTLDVAKAEPFYAKVFGWVGQSMNLGPMPYTTFAIEGRPSAGMMTLPEEAVKMQAKPRWLVYFAVTNCDATIADVVAAGGRLLQPAMDVQGIGRFAVMLDPQGGTFAFIQR
jgi:hypothetical protein